MSLLNWAARARRGAGFVWEQIFSGNRTTHSARKKRRYQRPHRALRIDPLEDRNLLSVAPSLTPILVNQTFGAQQITNTAHSIASDNNGDFVVAWTRYDNVTNNGVPVIDPSTGNQMTVANVYARYFTNEVQQVSLPGPDSTNAQGTVLPNGIASNFDNDPNSVGRFSLTFNSQTVMQIAVTAGTAPAGDAATTQANIAGQFTLWFDANGDGLITPNEVTTINFDETNPTLSASAIQTWLNTFNPTYSGNRLVSDGSHAVVTAIDPQHYVVDFGTATQGLDQSSLLQYLSPTDPRVPNTVSTTFSLSGFLPSVVVTTQSRPFTVNNIPVSQTDPNLTALAIENYFQGQVDAYKSGASPFTFPLPASILPTNQSFAPYTAPISTPTSSPGVVAATVPQSGFNPSITVSPVVNADGSLSYTSFDITFTGVSGAQIEPQLIISNTVDENGIGIGAAVPVQAGTTVNLIDAPTNTTVTVPWLSGWTETQVSILKESSPEFQVNPKQTISSIFQPTASILAADEPAVSMDASGDFVVAWRQQVSQTLAPKNVTDIYFRHFSPTGITSSYNPGSFVPGQTLDGEGQVTDDSGNVIPQVRLLPNPTVSDVQQIVFTATNGGSPPVTGSFQLQLDSVLTQPIAFNGSDLNATAANIEAALTTIGRSATVVPVLPSIQPGKPGVYTFKVTFNQGSIGTDEPPLQYVPVVDSSGNTMPVTFTQSSLTTDMYTVAANVNYTNPQATPAVAMDPQGNFNVVWAGQGQDLSYFNDIFMQRFDRDGNALGGEITVNTETTSEEFNPDVAMGPDDNSVVTWTRTDDPAALFGGAAANFVYVRGFDSSGNPLWADQSVGNGGGNSTVAMDSQDNFSVTYDALGDTDQNAQTSSGVFGIEYALESQTQLQATFTNSATAPSNSQTIAFNAATTPLTGAFELQLGTQATQQIQFNSGNLPATAAAMQAAINALGFNVTVTSNGATNPYTFRVVSGAALPIIQLVTSTNLPAPLLLRPEFRVSNGSTNIAATTAWPYDQFNAEVAMDQDGDIATSYQGYGPQVSQEIDIPAAFFRSFFKLNTDTNITGTINQDLLPYFNPFPHNGSTGDTLGFGLNSADANSILYQGDNENVQTAIDQVLFDAEYPATVTGDTNTPATPEQLGRLRSILESVAGLLQGDSYAALTSIINAAPAAAVPGAVNGANSSDDIVNTQRSGSDQRYYIVFGPSDESGSFQLQIAVQPTNVANPDVPTDVTPFTVTTATIQVPNPTAQFSPIDDATTATNIANAINAVLGTVYPGFVGTDMSVNVRELTSGGVGTAEYDARTGTEWDPANIPGMPSDAAVDAATANQTFGPAVNPIHPYVIYELTFQGDAHDVPITLGVTNANFQHWTIQPGQQGAVTYVQVGAPPPIATEGDYQGVQSAPSYNSSVAMTSEGDLTYAYTQQALQTDGTTPLNADGNPIQTNIFAEQVLESTNTAGPQLVDWSDGTTDNKHFLNGGMISGVTNVQYFVLTFDQPMLAGDPTVNPDSVLNASNYELIDSNGNVISNAIAHVDYGLSEVAQMASSYGLNPVPSNKYEVILTLDGNPNLPGNQALTDGTYTLQVNQAVPSSSTSVGQTGLRNIYGTPLYLSGFNPGGITFDKTITLGTASNPGPPGLAATDTPINAQRGGLQTDPAVASAASGEYIAVWTSVINGQSNIVGQIFGANGLAKGPEFTVNTTVSTTWNHPDVAMDPAGAFVVTWSGGGPGTNVSNTSDVFARRFNAQGQAIGGQFQVNQYVPSVQNASRVAMATDGSFVITWESYGEGSVASATTVNYAIYARAYAANGTPLTGVAYQPQGNEFQVSTPSTNARTNPDVAMDAADDFVIVWSGDFQSGSTWGVYGNYYTAATGKSTGEVLLNKTPNQRGSFTLPTAFDLSNTGPRVGMASSDGDFVVTWANYNPSTTTGYNIYARQFGPGAVPLSGTPSASGEFQVNENPATLQPTLKPPTIGWQLMPAVGVDAAGNFTIAWTSFGQDNAEVNNPSILDYGIYARMYFANGADFFDTKLGTFPLEYRVNATTLGNQVAPAVNRGDIAGDSVIAWVGPDTAANTTAIYARVVDPPEAAPASTNAAVVTTRSISVADTMATVNSSATQVTFTVTLSGVSTKTVTVNFTTVDGTAKAGTNYTAVSGSLTFTPGGSLSKTVTVNLAGMTAGGLANLNFQLKLSSPSNATLVRAAGTATIVDGLPAAPPTISVADTSISVGQTSGVALFAVSLSYAYTKTVTVTYSTVGGTAIAGKDFSAVTGTLTFLPGGAKSQTIGIPVAAMTAAGLPNKTFQLSLASPVNGTIARSSATGTIVDGYSTVSIPTVSIADTGVSVGTAATQAVFTVTLSKPSSNAVNIIYGTGDGTATSASGAYTPTWGSYTFPAGTTSTTISVPVAGLKTAGLSAKTFMLNIAYPTTGQANAIISRSSATATITDAISTGTTAGAPTVSVADVNLSVGTTATQAVFTISLSAPSSLPVNIIYGTGDGTATSASGAYTPTWGSYTFPAGTTTKTISVPVAAMKAAGLSPMTFKFNVAYPATGSANAVIVRPSATATITDSLTATTPAAAALPTVSVADVSLSVGSTATQALFTISLSAVSTKPVNIIYGTGDGTAKSASGAYTPTWGSYTFPAGTTTTTIAVPVAALKTAGLSPQTFIFNVAYPAAGAASANAVIVRPSATATIVDVLAAKPSLSVSSVAVTRPSVGTTPASFVVKLSAASTQSVTVYYTTSNVTALAGTDYAAISGMITFAPGVTSMTIPVNVLANSTRTGSYTFNLTLSSPSANATLLNNVGVGTINSPVTKVATTPATSIGATPGSSGGPVQASTVAGTVTRLS